MPKRKKERGRKPGPPRPVQDDWENRTWGGQWDEPRRKGPDLVWVD